MKLWHRFWNGLRNYQWRKPNSLKRRLVWRLMLLHGLTFVVFTVAIWLFIMSLGGKADLVDDSMIDHIAESLVHDATGKLILEDTPGMEWVRTNEFWFVARDSQGQTVGEGTPPEMFMPLVKSLGTADYAQVRIKEDQPEQVNVRKRDTRAGQVFIVVGTNASVSALLAVVIVSLILFLPITALLALVTGIAIPLIVRKSLRGVTSAETDAAKIDFDQRGMRLSVDRIPWEVKSLVAAVNDALVRLDEGYERHKRFLADAAHELKTPIAILQTRIDALPESQDKGRLIADVSRLGGLAEQLLDHQRFQHQRPDLKEVDLVELAGNVVADLAPIAIAAGYKISFDADQRRVLVLGDWTALERALSNLVQNAIAHGGNTGTISVYVERNGTIEVADAGPGIPPEDRDRIFEPFYRLRPMTAGHGLGLNLARDIAHRHNGHLSVNDSPEGGAAFRLALPRSADA